MDKNGNRLYTWRKSLLDSKEEKKGYFVKFVYKNIIISLSSELRSKMIKNAPFDEPANYVVGI